MPDQTPEVCAECGLDELGNLEHQEWLPFDEKPRGHPFRPAERPEGEWRRVGEVGHGEVHWRIDSRDIDAVVSLSLERAISSAAVAEARILTAALESNGEAAHQAAGHWRRIWQQTNARADRLERALEEAREAIREWFAAEAANPASASLEDGSAWWSRRASARARLRALVSTEGEAQR